MAAAPVNQQTVTLTPTERGTIERDADGDWALPFVLFVGDDDEFEIGVRQAFVIYSIANIPANAQIQSAQVGVTMDAH